MRGLLPATAFRLSVHGSLVRIGKAWLAVERKSFAAKAAPTGCRLNSSAQSQADFIPIACRLT